MPSFFRAHRISDKKPKRLLNMNSDGLIVFQRETFIYLIIR